MAILSTLGSPFSDVDVLGLAIFPTNLGFHSGILYVRDGESRILHLAFHHCLMDVPAAEPFRWANIGLDRDNKVVMAALVARVARIKPGIPYAFNSDGVNFDPISGEIISPPAGRGLTCATFILALFKVHGHQIVDESTWADRPEDDAWRDAILEMLEPRATADHYEAVSQDRNAPRFRPDEVVGAGHEEAWPVTQVAAEALAAQVRADLAV